MSNRIIMFPRHEKLPSERLRGECVGYRIASEILIGVADLECSTAIYDYVWSICQREADLHVKKPGEEGLR